MQGVWSRDDPCRVRWSGDGEVYNATIKRILRKKESFNLKALVHYDGFTTEDDEEVEIGELEPPVTKLRHDIPRAGPSSTTKNKSDEGRAPLFSPLRGDEEQERLSEKFRIWDEDEDVMVTKTPLRKTSWKTKSRTLMDDLVPSKPKKSPSRRKPPVVKTLCDKKLKVDTPKDADNSPRRKDVPVTPARKNLELSLHLSDSEEEEDVDHKKSTHSGFEDADLEKPKFRHKPNCPKVRLVISEPGAEKELSVPATINQYLFEYQREGIRFLYRHYRSGLGAILGDDMGLGKTVQVIGFLSALLRKTGTKTDVLKQRPKFIRRLSNDGYESDEDEGERKVYLIIGPASVLYNWVDELETWGHFSVGKFHKHHKEQTMADLDKKKLDIVVTTYETCRDHIRDLNRYNWDAVIADEAHKIKGMKAEITQALKALKCRRRYGLTGTALQNDMKELWCIFDWANPGCLGTVYQFGENFEKVMLAGQKQDATKRQLAEARKAKEKFAALRSKWFLRRTKALIADQLPEKVEQVVYCRATPFQLDVYKGILGHPDIHLILTQKDPCPCKSGRTRGKCHYKKSEDGRTVNQLMFSYLHLLMKTANHVALLMPERTANENQRRQAEDICELAFAKHPHFREQTQKAAFRTLSDPKYCGKMKVVDGLLRVFKKEKSKVLLFSLSTQLLDIIEQYVITTGYEYRRLDGKTPDVRRVKLVREFNLDPNIFLFLSSTKAGGVGLNLTGANVVIIYDPNWNPTHDIQAQDRAYRLGQGRDVRVYRLITMGTIEENIYLRQVFKQQLDRIAVSEENAKRLFYENEIKGVANMFKLRSSDCCLTMDILERNEKIETSVRGFTVGRYIPPAPRDGILDESANGDDEDEDDEGSEEDVEYFNTQEIIDDEISAPEPESEDDDRIAGKTGRKSIKEKHTKGQSFKSSSEFSDLIPPGQMAVQTRGTKNKRREIDKRERDRTVPEPTPSTSRASDRWASKRKIESSSDEEKVSLHRQESTLGVSASDASVSDVFERYGVPHMHDNRKLIGASKAEDHMTKCAIQDVYELHQYSQVPAAFCDPCTLSSEESDDIGRSSAKKSPSPEKKSRKEDAVTKSPFTKGACSMIIDKKKVLIGQTPMAIRRKQFDMMAKSVGKDKVSLAKDILTLSSEEQQEFLKRFYVNMDEKLSRVFELSEEENTNTDRKSTKKKTDKSDGKKIAPKRMPRKQANTVRGCQYQSDSDEDDQKITGKNRLSRMRRKRSKHVISSDSEVDNPDLVPVTPSMDLPKEKRTLSNETKCEIRTDRSKVSPRVPNHLDDLLSDILGEGSSETRKKAPACKQRVTHKPGTNIRRKSSKHVTSSDSEGGSPDVVSSTFSTNLPKGKKTLSGETECEFDADPSRVLQRVQNPLDDLLSDILGDDSTETRRKSPGCKLRDTRLPGSGMRSKRSKYVISSDSEEGDPDIIPSSVDLPKGRKTQSHETKCENSAHRSGFSPSVHNPLDDFLSDILGEGTSETRKKPSACKQRVTQIPKSPKHFKSRPENLKKIKELETSCGNIIDEIIDGNSAVVKRPPKKSPVKTPRPMEPEATCSETKTFVSPAKSRNILGLRSPTLDKSHLLDDLGIFSDEKVIPKPAPKRKHLPTHDRSEVKVKKTVNVQEDSPADNSLDLFSDECKLIPNATPESISNWEKELDEISPKKKQKRTSKR